MSSRRTPDHVIAKAIEKVLAEIIGRAATRASQDISCRGADVGIIHPSGRRRLSRPRGRNASAGEERKCSWVFCADGAGKGVLGR
jgi:hypothetical protein